MVMASVNPHRLTFPCALESALAVKVECSSIRNNHVLVKSTIAFHKLAHQFRTDAACLIIRVNEQMRIVNDEVPVRNSVAETDKPLGVPSGEKRVRTKQSTMEHIGLSGR